MNQDFSNHPDIRESTKSAQTVVASLRRLGMALPLIPKALNDLGFRTVDGELFTLKEMKQLLRGKTGAKR